MILGGNFRPTQVFQEDRENRISRNYIFIIYLTVEATYPNVALLFKRHLACSSGIISKIFHRCFSFLINGSLGPYIQGVSRRHHQRQQKLWEGVPQDQQNQKEQMCLQDHWSKRDIFPYSTIFKMSTMEDVSIGTPLIPWASSLKYLTSICWMLVEEVRVTSTSILATNRIQAGLHNLVINTGNVKEV